MLFDHYQVAIFCLISSIITIFIHRWFLEQVKIYSDFNVRLIKLLVVGAGDLYLNDILPEFGLLMIRAAEALMNPTKIRFHIGFDYSVMLEELEDRVNYDQLINKRNRQKPSLTTLAQIDRSAYLMPRY